MNEQTQNLMSSVYLNLEQSESSDLELMNKFATLGIILPRVFVEYKRKMNELFTIFSEYSEPTIAIPYISTFLKDKYNEFYKKALAYYTMLNVYSITGDKEQRDLLLKEKESKLQTWQEIRLYFSNFNFINNIRDVFYGKNSLAEGFDNNTKEKLINHCINELTKVNYRFSNKEGMTL